MSLINKMLQDLDARRATEGPGVLPTEVRALAPEAPRKSGGGRLAAIGGATLVLGGAAWLLLEQFATPVVSTLPAPAFAPAPPVQTPQPVHTSTLSAPVEQPSADVPKVAEPIPSASAAKTNGVQEPAPTSPKAATNPAKPAPARPSTTVRAAPKRAPVIDDGLRLSRTLAFGDRSGTFSPPSVAASTASPAAAYKAPAGDGRVEKTVRPLSSYEQADLVYRKAIVAVNQRRLDDAIDGLRSSLALDSVHAPARQVLVRLLLEQRREPEAVSVLEDGIKRHPEQTQWALYLARIQLERGTADDALATLQLAREPAAGSHEYRGFLAALLQRTGNHAGAVETYRRALALAPAEGRYWVGLGISQEAIGQTEAAHDSYRRARTAINLPADLSAFVDGRLR
jgi:MSHA biogenesis protein MshN